MTTTATLTVCAWALVGGRVAVLAARSTRGRRRGRAGDEPWHPRVSSGCGR